MTTTSAMNSATVGYVLKRAGLSRLRDIESSEPVRRYEHAHPGDMIHIDIREMVIPRAKILQIGCNAGRASAMSKHTFKSPFVRHIATWYSLAMRAVSFGTFELGRVRS